jgi:hypothetical protein
MTAFIMYSFWCYGQALHFPCHEIWKSLHLLLECRPPWGSQGSPVYAFALY